MSHHFNSGFFVKEAAWHQLGNVIQQAPSIEEGIKLAGLDWNVTLKDLVIKENQKAVTHRAVVREDTGATLGIVGPNWQPLQNIDSFKFFDQFIEAGQVELETAGALREGGVVWVLAKIKRSPVEIVKGDPLERYVLLSNGHNGMLAVRVGFTTVRVVCNNTLNIAHNSDASKLIRIKHSSRVQQNLENIKMVMDVAESEFLATVDQMRLLARKDINQQDIKDYVHISFFDGRPLDNTRTINNYNRMVNRMEQLIETGLGSDIKNVKGSVWSLYNAATEYLTHEACKTV